MFLSIITPYFNQIEKVKKCIALLEKQNYKDFELILIDDASTDSAKEEIDNIIDKHSFDIKHIHNTLNSGPGVSRNKGIDLAVGEYILFLDSDDYIDNSTIMTLKSYIANYKYDCIIFDYILVKNMEHKRSSLMCKRFQGSISTTDAILYSSGSVCCKMYRTNILLENHIRFPDIYIKEDMVFNKIALFHCKNIVYLKRNLYFYVINNQSLMQSSRAMNAHNDILAFEQLERELNLAPQTLEALFIKELLYAGTLHMLCSKQDSKNISEFLSFWIKKYPNWHTNTYINMLPIRMKILLKGIHYKNWCLLKCIAFIKNIIS